MSEVKALSALLDLIRDDGYAISFQSFGQYRTALANEIKRQVRGLEREAVTGNAEAIRYRNERDALQLLLNAADQRNDDLTQALSCGKAAMRVKGSLADPLLIAGSIYCAASQSIWWLLFIPWVVGGWFINPRWNKRDGWRFWRE